uniref:Glutathione S-transferase mu 4 n=1 Tax=Monodon monoceros TaxID=40151 RepID=A0A8C6C9W1_MONMO
MGDGNGILLNEKSKLGLDFPNEKLKPDYLKEIPKTMKLFSDFLGKRPWFAGDKVRGDSFGGWRAVIFPAFRVWCPFTLCLSAAHLCGLKKISAYMKSSCFLPGPLFLKTAMWGNKYCPVTRRRE